jgi:hypothetical protein
MEAGARGGLLDPLLRLLSGANSAWLSSQNRKSSLSALFLCLIFCFRKTRTVHKAVFPISSCTFRNYSLPGQETQSRMRHGNCEVISSVHERITRRRARDKPSLCLQGPHSLRVKALIRDYIEASNSGLTLRSQEPSPLARQLL